MKRIASVLMTLVCFLALTSCHGLPPTVAVLQKQDDDAAESILQVYRQPFIDKVNKVYGDSASLTDIECVRVYPDYYDPGYSSYHEELKATLTINGTDYEALFNCKKATLRDSVHTDAICSELTDALPLDKSKIIEVVIPKESSSWNYGEQWKFPCEVKNLDDAVTWNKRGDASIFIWIYTSEDVSGFTEEDISSIPEINKLKDSTSFDMITIISLTDESALADLKEYMDKNSGLSMLGYPSTTEETIAEFSSKYHMTNVLIVKNDFDIFDESNHCLVINKIID